MALTRRAALQHLAHMGWVLPALTLSACGFELRKAPRFEFKALFLNNVTTNAFGVEMLTVLSQVQGLKILVDPRDLDQADMIFDLNSVIREKVIIGRTSTGAIREFQLRIKILFKVRTPEGIEKIPEAEMIQRRDVSFNESAVLAKEMEEELLYQNMQTDLTYQILRRLAAIQVVR
jgi:LPS-assembly lipoprotein